MVDVFGGCEDFGHIGILGNDQRSFGAAAGETVGAHLSIVEFIFATQLIVVGFSSFARFIDFLHGFSALSSSRHSCTRVPLLACPSVCF